MARSGHIYAVNRLNNRIQKFNFPVANVKKWQMPGILCWQCGSDIVVEGNGSLCFEMISTFEKILLDGSQVDRLCGDFKLPVGISFADIVKSF